jgi:hypothetical protein
MADLPNKIDTYEELLLDLYNKTWVQEKIVMLNIHSDLFGEG